MRFSNDEFPTEKIPSAMSIKSSRKLNVIMSYLQNLQYFLKF